MLTVSSIKSVVRDEVLKAYTITGVTTGTTFVPSVDADGRPSVTAQTQTGSLPPPSNAEVDRLADMLTNILFKVLTQLSEVEVTIAGRVQGSYIEGTGTGKVK